MNKAQKMVFFLKKNPNKWYKRKDLINEIGMSEPSWSVIKEPLIKNKYVKETKKANNTYYKADVRLIEQSIEESLKDLEGIWIK